MRNKTKKIGSENSKVKQRFLKPLARLRKWLPGLSWSQVNERFVDAFGRFHSGPYATIAESALPLDNIFGSSLILALLNQRALTTFNL